MGDDVVPQFAQVTLLTLALEEFEARFLRGRGSLLVGGGGAGESGSSSQSLSAAS